MNSELIHVPALSGTPTVTQDAFDRRDLFLMGIGLVSTVTTRIEADEAALSLTKLKAFTREIEAERKQVKAPIILLSKSIDQLAKDLVCDLTQEGNRVGGLIGDYQAEQERLRRKAAAEAAEQERQIKEEAEAKALKAIESGRSVEKKLDKIDEKAFTMIAAVRAVEATAPTKIAGLATRRQVKIEVLDIYALAASRPELVEMQINTSAVTAIVRKNPNLVLPGIRHWTENTTVVR